MSERITEFAGFKVGDKVLRGDGKVGKIIGFQRTEHLDGEHIEGLFIDENDLPPREVYIGKIKEQRA